MKALAPLLLAAALAGAEEKKPDEKPKGPVPAGSVDFGDPATKIEDSSVARQEVVRFQKEMKAAGKDFVAKAKALTRLGKWDHPLVFQAAAKYIRDKNHVVAAAAAVTCGRQTGDPGKSAKAFYRAARKEKRTRVLCALIVGLGRFGADDKKTRQLVLGYFQKNIGETHRAAIRYYGHIKAKDAFRMLAGGLDQPMPDDPDDPNNPPASFWKEQYGYWEKNLPFTKWALKQIVPDETFDSTKEAQGWAENQGAEHGIKW